MRSQCGRGLAGPALTRGDLVTAILPGDYGKPRPVAVVQSDMLAALDSVIVCPLSSDLSTEGPFRVGINPDPANGLLKPSSIMIDKINAVSKDRCRGRIGRLNTEQLEAVDQSLRLVFGLDIPR